MDYEQCTKAELIGALEKRNREVMDLRAQLAHAKNYSADAILYRGERDAAKAANARLRGLLEQCHKWIDNHAMHDERCDMNDPEVDDVCSCGLDALIKGLADSHAVAIAATECPACAKLPRTADNVPVTLGMNLYAPNVDFDFGCLQMNADEDTSILCRDERGVEFSMYTFDCYSTREALEAARSTADQADEQ